MGRVRSSRGIAGRRAARRPWFRLVTPAAPLLRPDVYRIILLDQRGAGRSTPLADITDNTAYHLIDDIEQLRRHLGIAAFRAARLRMIEARDRPSARAVRM